MTLIKRGLDLYKVKVYGRNINGPSGNNRVDLRTLPSSGKEVICSAAT